jgi:hypothetical protein
MLPTLSPRQQCAGDRVRREVVDGEVELAPLLREAPGRCHHPGVVDQCVDALGHRRDRVGELPAAGRGGDVAGEYLRVRAGSAPKLFVERFHPLGIAAGGDHAVASLGELEGHRPADAAGGSDDDHRTGR